LNSRTHSSEKNYINKEESLRRRAYFPLYDKDRTEIDASNNSPLLRVFVAMATSSQSRYPATIGRYSYMHTELWERVMKFAVEMGSCAMIYVYIPGLTKTGSGVQKLIGEGGRR
jgi:acetyl-CoA carboxylase carboxyltransferase component